VRKRHPLHATPAVNWANWGRVTEAEPAKAKRRSAPANDGTVKARKKLNKVERIAYIVGIMAENQWVTGITGPQLAAKWKISIETVAKDAQEASRTFNADPTERAELRARWFSKIESAQKKALRKGQFIALAQLLKLEGDHLGAFDVTDKGAATKHRVEVVFTDTQDPSVGSAPS